MCLRFLGAPGGAKIAQKSFQEGLGAVFSAIFLRRATISILEKGLGVLFAPPCFVRTSVFREPNSVLIDLKPFHIRPHFCSHRVSKMLSAGLLWRAFCGHLGHKSQFQRAAILHCFSAPYFSTFFADFSVHVGHFGHPKPVLKGMSNRFQFTQNRF